MLTVVLVIAVVLFCCFPWLLNVVRLYSAVSLGETAPGVVALSTFVLSGIGVFVVDALYIVVNLGDNVVVLSVESIPAVVAELTGVMTSVVFCSVVFSAGVNVLLDKAVFCAVVLSEGVTLMFGELVWRTGCAVDD